LGGFIVLKMLFAIEKVLTLRALKGRRLRPLEVPFKEESK
tara:strand:- start:396 stop:515 length:120 start_codon:yes stop_codon:yes gene_type:complete